MADQKIADRGRLYLMDAYYHVLWL